MPAVYIETTIISYLTARPSTQVIVAARQLLTRQWWEYGRRDYDVCVSQYVLDEASRGDPVMASLRQDALEDIPLLDLPEEIPDLAVELLARTVLPPKARLDALHISAAAYHGVEYLLTWNCSHIANAKILPSIYHALSELGHSPPIICTPEEMIADEYSID